MPHSDSANKLFFWRIVIVKVNQNVTNFSNSGYASWRQFKITEAYFITISFSMSFTFVKVFDFRRHTKSTKAIITHCSDFLEVQFKFDWFTLNSSHKKKRISSSSLKKQSLFFWSAVSTPVLKYFKKINLKGSVNYTKSMFILT